MIYLLAILFSFNTHADFIWDELPKNLPVHENVIKAAKTGLSVFWWNTQMGDLNQEIYRTRKFYPLDSNLNELSQTMYLPDVIILGEYNEKNFGPKTIWDLKKIYPFNEIVVNNTTSQKNIAIYSKYEFTASHQLLDWADNEKQRIEYKKIYKTSFFDRQFIHVTISKENKTYHLIPAHLLNQWADLLAHYQKKFGKDIGKLKFGEEMIEGQFNPMMSQIRQLKNKISKNLPLTDHVILGDMNCPGVVYNIPAACHNSLKLNLIDSMSNKEATYPAASAHTVLNMPPMKIDHAVHSKNLIMKFPQVLPLLGSDHYPLMFVIQTKLKK